MYPKYRWLLRSLRHPKTVISLIVSALFFSFLSQIIPQADNTPLGYFTSLQQLHPVWYWLIKQLQLDQIFTSSLFTAVIFLLFLSLALTVYEQFTRQYRYRARVASSQQNNLLFRIFIKETSQKELVNLANQLSKIIRSLGYRVRDSYKDNTVQLLATHHSIGFFGSTIFHFGLLLVVGTAIVGSLSYTSGFVQIPDGGTLFGKNPSWLTITKGIMVKDISLDFDITLNGFYKDYWSDQQTKQLTSYLILREHKGSSTLQSLSISRPLQFHGFTLYQTWWQSYAISFLMASDKSTILGTFLLNPPQKEQALHAATSNFPGSKYIFNIQLSANTDPNQLAAQKNPLWLTIHEADTLQYSGPAHRNKPIVLGDKKITLVDIRPWSGIRVVRWYGHKILYAGFFLIVMGVFLMYILRPREIYIHMKMIENAIHGNINSRTNHLDDAMQDDLSTIDQKISLFKKDRVTKC